MQANVGIVMADNRLMMINFLIGFRFISIYVIFVKMVGDDDIFQTATFLLNRLFDA